MKKREIILLIGSLSFLLLIVFLSLLLADRFQVQSCGCPKVISHNFLYLFIFLATIFIASLVYYLTSMKIQSQEKIMDKNIEVLLSFLDSNEREILSEIVKNKGELSQSELNLKFGKLKAHRSLQKLKQRGIININSTKNRNHIKLKDEFRKELVK
jgi:hypothetical protein